jgi:hypothetical protein
MHLPLAAGSVTSRSKNVLKIYNNSN